MVTLMFVFVHARYLPHMCVSYPCFRGEIPVGRQSVLCFPPLCGSRFLTFLGENAQTMLKDVLIQMSIDHSEKFAFSCPITPTHIVDSCWLQEERQGPIGSHWTFTSVSITLEGTKAQTTAFLHLPSGP